MIRYIYIYIMLVRAVITDLTSRERVPYTRGSGYEPWIGLVVCGLR